MRCPLALLVFLFASFSVRAQEVASPSESAARRIQFFGGSAGVGGGHAAGYEDAAIGVNVQATAATRRYAASVRFTRAEEFSVFGLRPKRKFTEVALLAGAREHFAGGWLLARAQAGLGFVVDYGRGAPVEDSCAPGTWVCARDYERKVARAVGVAGQMDLLLTPLRYLGLGVRCGGNINGTRSFGALSLALHVGRLY